MDAGQNWLRKRSIHSDEQLDAALSSEAMKGIGAWHNEWTGTWWSWAKNEDNLDRAPDFLRPVIMGKVTRVLASNAEIDAAIAWAQTIEGWDPLPPESKPLHVFDLDRRGVPQETRQDLIWDDDRR